MKPWQAPYVECHGRLHVVRDDLIVGGTKRRFVDPYLETVEETTVVYASPAYGYAQIAIAAAAREAGKAAVIFTARRKHMHERTREAARLGATIIPVDHGRLSVVNARAREYSAAEGARLIPFGINVPGVEASLVAAAQQTITPREVWLAAGSGTLCRALQKAWPEARFFAVRVGAVPDVGNATLIRAPEPFERDAKHPPPWPSCSNYDAKVWQFASLYAQPDALIWNVAA